MTLSPEAAPLVQGDARNLLEKLDFEAAEEAFAAEQDYNGVRFVQNVSKLDPSHQRAEILAFLGHHDEAEKLLLSMNRLDLAIQLRSKLGDWLRVSQLGAEREDGKDEVVRRAQGHLGEKCAHSFSWAKAAHYYMLAEDMEKAALAFYRAGDYEGLERVAHQLNDNSPTLLRDIAAMFHAVGMHKQVVFCYRKLGDIKSALDSCIVLNQWEEAVSLAEEGDYAAQMQGLILARVNGFLEKGDKMMAVELYRRTNKSDEAAKLLTQIADEVFTSGDPVSAKKLHVMAAIEVEKHRDSTLSLSSLTSVSRSSKGHSGSSFAAATATMLDTLMSTDSASESSSRGSSVKVLDNAWRGASACHYFLLAQRQFREGLFESATKTAIRCAEFAGDGDALNAQDVYSLIALASYHSRYFWTSSKAFIKLETLPDIDEAHDIQAQAMQIFTKHPPHDPEPPLAECYVSCLDIGAKYDACTVTGCSISDQRTIKCKRCHHFMIESETNDLENCPLCHDAIGTGDAGMITIAEEDDEY